MADISNETLTRLYKKQKTMLTSGFVVSAAVFITDALLREYITTNIEGATTRIILLLACLAILIIPFVYTAYITKQLIPPGNRGAVRRVMKTLNNDFTSDNIVNKLHGEIIGCGKYAEKIRLTLLLADVYSIRGEYREALELLYNADRSGFSKYPELGLSFFGEIINIYSELGDSESVLNAYSDARSFIDETADKNYMCQHTAFSLMISVEKARGNYSKALEMQLCKNGIENLFNSSEGASQQGTPLMKFIRGTVFCNTAELFYLCGDYISAAKYLDIGGPMLAVSPAATQQANKLSEKLRAAQAMR